MNELLALEAMGYRFRLDGDRVRYRVVGTPPDAATALLARLDKQQVRQILHAREQGYTTLRPQEIVVSWPDRYRYMHAVKAALDAGALLDVKVTYVRKTRECIYHVIPPRVDLRPWLTDERS